MFPEDVDFDEELDEIEKDDKFIYNLIGVQYDFERQELPLKDGNPILITEEEAIRLWIKKNLLTRLQAYKIYHRENDEREYGSALVPIVRGKKMPRIMILAEAERDVREMCLRNPYIQNIENFEIIQSGFGGYISFDVVLNDYRVINIEEEVNI